MTNIELINKLIVDIGSLREVKPYETKYTMGILDSLIILETTKLELIMEDNTKYLGFQQKEEDSNHLHDNQSF